MTINFHDGKNSNSYTGRLVDQSWQNIIRDLVPLDNIDRAAEIGCGGGIYTRTLSDMGISSITGVDFSNVMLETARRETKKYKSISFIQGEASHTNFKAEELDMVLSRALIHHLDDLPSHFKEVNRILRKDGIHIIQDRTPEDCFLEGSPDHLRGYFFSLFPKLKEKEKSRRYESSQVRSSLLAYGFNEIKEIKLWELRKVFQQKTDVLKELRLRKGRSILHELTNTELTMLVNYIDEKLPAYKQVIEKDRWTIWHAVK